MPREIIFENGHVTLWYYPETKIIHHKFHKFVSGKNLREPLTAGLELLRKNGAVKWLSDDRENSALPQEDGLWATNEWFPRAVAAGWKFWALVQPQNVIGQMNIKRFVSDYSRRGVTVKVFDDPDDALAWLESQ
jgi:hypothetical protein